VSVNGNGQHIRNASAYTFNGNTEFIVGNNSGNAIVPDRLNDAATLTLNGARFQYLGQAFSGASVGMLAQETLGTLHFASGFSYNTIGHGNNSSGTRLDTTLDRSAGATASWRGASFGGAAGIRQVIFSNASDYLIGGGAAAGSTNVSVLPWMVAESNNQFAANPSSFATHDANGLRQLNTSTTPGVGEYVLDIAAAGPTDNVSDDSVALAADKTINALRVNGGAGNIGAGRTLTVASGGVIIVNNGNGIGSAVGPNAGTLNFGAAEGVIISLAANVNPVRSVLAGSNGLTKGGTGTLVLGADNAYAGTTYAGAGTLQVGEGTMGGGTTTTPLADLGDGDVFVAQNATVAIRSGVTDAIDDDAAVSLDSSGVAFGRMNLDATVNELVAALLLDGVSQIAGTYGSSSSLATFKDDNYFAGAGMLTVVPIPEPATAGLLTVAAGLLTLRRRRRMTP
jgi:autotransporter-associated beta strand protein